MGHIKLTISEVADVLGIAPKTIRHYHAVGVLPEPDRGENGYRLYSGADLRRLHTIRDLQAYGLSLKQIRLILEADDSDRLLHAFLVQRDRELAAELSRLGRQQARVRAALTTTSSSGDPAPPSGPPAASTLSTVLHTAIRPISTSLADVLVEVEAAVLAEIERLYPNTDQAAFWDEIAPIVARSIVPHEHTFILWLERYLAVAEMTHDDRQAQAWLTELRSSSAATVLVRALDLPSSPLLPPAEQAALGRLLPLLLYEQATPLQRAFLAALQSKVLR